jgi:hypothetical protein
MNKNFSEVAVGANFFADGIEYTKTDTVRISCCQSINAHIKGDPNNRKFFQDSTTVTVNA